MNFAVEDQTPSQQKVGTEIVVASQGGHRELWLRQDRVQVSHHFSKRPLDSPAPNVLPPPHKHSRSRCFSTTKPQYRATAERPGYCRWLPLVCLSLSNPVLFKCKFPTTSRYAARSTGVARPFSSLFLRQDENAVANARSIKPAAVKWPFQDSTNSNASRDVPTF